MKQSPNSQKDAQIHTKGQQNINDRNQCVIPTDLFENALFSINVMTFFFSLYIKLVTKEKTHSQAGQESVKEELQRENKASGYKLARKPQVYLN